MADSPTIVVARLDDEELQKSIKSVVSAFNQGLNDMKTHADSVVKSINESLKGIKGGSASSGGVSDGGSTKRAKATNEETAAVEKNIAAREKQIKTIEKSMTLDQGSVAIRRAVSPSGGVLEQYDNQIMQLRNRLAEVRKDIDIFNYAIGSGKKTQVSWGQEGLRKANQEAERLMTTIATLEKQRGNLTNILAPQGHTIQNFVNSLQKANPELAQLNAQFKRGQSLLQNQYIVTESTSKDRERLVAATERENKSLAEQGERLEHIRTLSNEVASAQTSKRTGVPMPTTVIDSASASHAYFKEQKNMAALSQSGNEFKNMLAGLLKVKEDDIKVTNIENASYEQLKQYLKQLTSAYEQLSTSQMKLSRGRELANEIQRVNRALSDMNRMAKRPASLKDALSGSEKTLDDVAYKIQRLRAYMQGLDTSNEKSSAEFKRAALNVQLLKEKENELLQKNSQLLKSNNQLFASNTALGRSWNYMKNRLAFYFTVGVGTQLVKELIRVRSEYEMNEKALGILINSAERGSQIFQELSQMALVSPYTLIELSAAAKQLTAYDVAAKDVVDTTRRLADMTAAVGIPIERLTYALGQIKSYGYLNSRDARMFANAGIPLVKQLSDYYTELEGNLVSTADIYDRIKKKAIGYNDVMNVVYRMTDEGGKFFDYQAKMADTLKVQLANLTLAWNNMINEIGASQQGMLSLGLSGLKHLFLAWQDVTGILTAAAATFGVVRAAQMLNRVVLGKQTIATLEYVVANTKATASEYQRALSVRKLTAEQATWLLLTQKSNKALVAAIARMGLFDAATIKAVTSLSGIRKGIALTTFWVDKAISGLIRGVKALGAAFLSNWPVALIFAAVDAWQHFSQVADNNAELNKKIADGAKEAAEALNDFLRTDVNVQARLAAQQKQLTSVEGEKQWEAIREQIELSAASAKLIIPELVAIPDINERVSASFDYAERIQKATEALQDLEDELEYSQNSWLGLFGDGGGEGIEEDIEDYMESVKNLQIKGEAGSVWDRLFYGEEGGKERLSSDLAEATNEINKFASDAAHVIKEQLGREGVADPVQVTEAVERVIKAAEQKMPKLRGVGKMLFESLVGEEMSKAFGDSYDMQEQYYKMFLEQLGKDYGSKFRDVTDEITEDTHQWSGEQRKAIEATAEKIKKQLPEASQEAIDKILEQLNSTDFKFRIVAEFATTSLDKLQKSFRSRFILDAGTSMLTDESERDKKRKENIQKYQVFMRKTGEDNVAYQKRISEEYGKQQKLLEDNQKIIDKGGDVNVIADAKESTKAATAWIAAMKEVEEWGGYDFSTKQDRKDAKAAESELQKALKEELSLIEKVRSIYKDLTKEGASHANAVRRATSGWSETVNAINKVLAKNGLQKLDLTKFAGISNPRELVNMLQSQLDALVRRGAKPAEIKELQTKIQTLNVDVDKYDLTKITKGLNSELDKLKEEYELAVELDANPELGSLFADWWDIDMEGLPHTAQAYAERATKLVNQYLKDEKAGLELPLLTKITNDDLRSLREAVDADQFNAAWLEIIEKAVKASRDVRKKEASDQITDWDNLLQKYAEYEYKKTQIAKTAEEERRTLVERFGTDEQKERFAKIKTELDTEQDPEKKDVLKSQLIELVDSIASSNDTALQIKTSIDTKELRDYANLDFTEFQKTGTWVVATGDLATMSRQAIGLLIDRLNEYKKNAKNLDPKDIKKLNNALKALHREMRRGNIFKEMMDAMAQAKERTEEYQQEIDSLVKEYNNLEDKKNMGIAMSIKELDRMQELKKRIQELREEQKLNGLVAIEVIVQTAQAAAQVTSQALGSVASMFDALGDKKTAKVLKDVDTVLNSMGQWAAMGGSVGGGWGALAGAIAGAGIGLVQVLGDIISGNADITEQVEDIEDGLRDLENAYKSVEYTIEKTYGAAKVAAIGAAKASKEAQLAELKRELALEQSRKAKNRDDEKIAELKGQIIDLQNEITDMIDNIATDLMGISSVGDAIEDIVSSMIDAFKKGEDYMKEYDNSFAEMIDNMIAKSIASSLISDTVENIAKKIKDAAEERINKSGLEEEYRHLVGTERGSIAEMENRLTEWEADVAQRTKDDPNHWRTLQGIADVEKLRQEIEDAKRRRDELATLLAQEVVLTPEDINSVREDANNARQQVKENFEALMEAYGITFGQDAEGAKLSALQQGISQITEETAGALEAITSGMYQQVSLQSTLLTQIRDVVIGLNPDITLGVQSQMLLQLQNSYVIQQTILSTMQGWSSPTGNSVRVVLEN